MQQVLEGFGEALVREYPGREGFSFKQARVWRWNALVASRTIPVAQPRLPAIWAGGKGLVGPGPGLRRLPLGGGGSANSESGFPTPLFVSDDS
jgi:hypothetical protein